MFFYVYRELIIRSNKDPQISDEKTEVCVCIYVSASHYIPVVPVPKCVKKITGNDYFIFKVHFPTQ